MHHAAKRKRARLIRELTDAALEWNTPSYTYDEESTKGNRLTRICLKLERHMEQHGGKHPWEDGVL